MIKPWPEEWIRQELEAHLQLRFNPEQWAYLRDKTDLIQDAQAGRMDIAFAHKGPFGSGGLVNFPRLAAQVREKFNALGVKPPHPVRPPEAMIPEAQSQMDALSRILDARLRQRDDVKVFRGTRRKTKSATEKLMAALMSETGWSDLETRYFLAGNEIRMLAVKPLARRGRYITMLVDPIVSPPELARAYGEIRRGVAGSSRMRRLSAKHLELAVFMARQPDTAKPMWEKRMALWNTKAPKKWHYRQVTNFARDCVVAQRRMGGAK